MAKYDLEFDTDVMKSSAQKFITIGNEMTELKDKLQKDINELKDNYWQSSAGDAFNELYSAEWGNNLDKYVLILQELSKILTKAVNEYEEVAAEVGKLSFSSGGTR